MPDLGLDQVLIYRLDPATGRFTPNEPPHARTEPGGGPRHMAFHPSGRFAYVNLEMSSRVGATGWMPRRAPHRPCKCCPPSPGVTVPGNSTAETLLHPSGRFLYVSNRGHDSIAVFAINEQDGTLRFIETTPTGTARRAALACRPMGAGWLRGIRAVAASLCFGSIQRAACSLQSARRRHRPPELRHADAAVAEAEARRGLDSARPFARRD